MPAYEVDGTIMNISLHTVKVQNWDKTITVIPTYRLLDAPYKNWRGMQESGGRRIKRAINIDLNSVKFCDRETLERFRDMDLIGDYLEDKLPEAGRTGSVPLNAGGPLDTPQLTNMEVFQAYVTNYLKGRGDLHHEGMTLLVRQLAPGPTGLPLEIYAFTKTVDWLEYEAIQAEILDHLIGAMPQFDLRVFQEPTGADLRTLIKQSWVRSPLARGDKPRAPKTKACVPIDERAVDRAAAANREQG
jgi:miniconductance mechanosensitive channel